MQYLLEKCHLSCSLWVISYLFTFFFYFFPFFAFSLFSYLIRSGLRGLVDYRIHRNIHNCWQYIAQRFWWRCNIRGIFFFFHFSRAEQIFIRSSSTYSVSLFCVKFFWYFFLLFFHSSRFISSLVSCRFFYCFTIHNIIRVREILISHTIEYPFFMRFFNGNNKRIVITKRYSSEIISFYFVSVYLSRCHLFLFYVSFYLH